ncbi:MAG: sensor histidine kinase, partial [Brevinematales bacterium]
CLFFDTKKIPCPEEIIDFFSCWLTIIIREGGEEVFFMVLDGSGIISLSFLQNIIDALPFQIAILDEKGVIRLVNEAWRCFARENGLDSDEIGANYIEITQSAAPMDKSAREVLEALQRVLAGENIHTFVEYPCHSPTERRYFHVHISGFTHEGKRWVILSHENVTAEVLHREKEQEMYQRFQDLFIHMQEGVVLHEWIRNEQQEIVDYRIVAANDAFARYTDLDIETSVGMPATRVYGTNPPPYFDIYKRVYETKKAETFETYYAPMNRYFWISAIPWGDGFATIFLDITILRKQQKMLEDALERKQFLFRELQHRAKNTFSSIAGLIGLVALDYSGDVYEVLLKLREQVVAMARVYEILYYKGESKVIDLSFYLSSVLEGFKKSFCQIFENVKIRLELEPVTVSAQRAHLIGLWVTEVLTNAVKYAFGEKREGWLSLDLREKDGMVELVYADGGREQGEKTMVKIETESSGFGSQVMLMVVDELSGTQEIERGDGIKIVLRFPHSEEDKEEARG